MVTKLSEALKGKRPVLLRCKPVVFRRSRIEEINLKPKPGKDLGGGMKKKASPQSEAEGESRYVDRHINGFGR